MEHQYAAIIISYWLSRGYRVDVRLEGVESKYGGTMSAIRSDMVNGLPRNWTTAVQSDLAVAVR